MKRAKVAAKVAKIARREKKRALIAKKLRARERKEEARGAQPSPSPSPSPKPSAAEAKPADTKAGDAKEGEGGEAPRRRRDELLARVKQLKAQKVAKVKALRKAKERADKAEAAGTQPGATTGNGTAAAPAERRDPNLALSRSPSGEAATPYEAAKAAAKGAAAAGAGAAEEQAKPPANRWFRQYLAKQRAKTADDPAAQDALDFAKAGADERAHLGANDPEQAHWLTLTLTLTLTRTLTLTLTLTLPRTTRSSRRPSRRSRSPT